MNNDNQKVAVVPHREGFTCPACGAVASDARIAQLAIQGGGTYVCTSCEERSFVIVRGVSRIIDQVICPVCGQFLAINKLERDGTAIVPCLSCKRVKKNDDQRRRNVRTDEGDDGREWRKIAITTDYAGKVIGIEEYKKIVDKRWKPDVASLILGLVAAFLLYVFNSVIGNGN